MMHSSLFVAAATLAAVTATTSPVPASLVYSAADASLTLSNGCVNVVFNLQRGSTDVVEGRFECDGAFAGVNVAAKLQGFSAAYRDAPQGMMQGAFAVVVTGDGVGVAETSTSATDLAAPLSFTVVANSSSYAAFSVGPLMDTSVRAGFVSRVATNLTFALSAGDRAFSVNASSTALRAFNTTVVRFATAWWPASAVAVYQRGVRQGFNNLGGAFIASVDAVTRWYSLGYGGAVDITPVAPITVQTIMFAGRTSGKRTGIDVVLAGGVPSDTWMDGFEHAGVTTVQPGALPSIALRVAPNAYDFPVGAMSTSTPTLPVDDARAIATGVYGSPMAALHSYDYSPETRIAPCIDSDGGVCYGGMYNFYDPDTFISISAMIQSYDTLVMDAARGLIETNGRFLCDGSRPGVCELGQMMHHFVPNCGGDPSCFCVTNPVNPAVQDCVTYQAISGAIQTGPNIFWTWAALRYAAASGNGTWLASNAPLLRRSMSFLLARLDASVGLFSVPGSLFIDTFKRANYTSDTNAAMVLLLQAMSDAETFLGNSSGAAAYAQLATTVAAAYNTYLLAPGGDHYCTNSNPVPGSPGTVVVCARDFVDYDSNLLAVAARIPNTTVAARVLARVDSGACAHPLGATYVSEVYYDAANCESGNTGDSDVTMGRIAWLDALARLRMSVDAQAGGSGDGGAAADAFRDLLLAPLQADLLTNTWLYERYTCQGTPTHNPYYIEMPEIVAMLVAEVKYGLTWSMMGMRVTPIDGAAAAPFAWAFGDLGALTYTHNAVTVTLNYAATKAFVFGGMAAGSYGVTVAGAPITTVTVGTDGMLSFSAAFAAGAAVSATLK